MEKEINNGSSPKIAIVSDGLYAWGGAEFVIKTILDIYSDAVIFTSVSDKRFVNENFPLRKVLNSFINFIPFSSHFRKQLIFLYPLAYRTFNFEKYDLVISVSSAFGKFVHVSKPTKHILICLTPPRFLWFEESRSTRIKKTFSFIIYNLIKKPLHNYWRRMDVKAVRAADKIVSISHAVRERVLKYYHLESDIIYPPVEVKKYISSDPHLHRENWYLYLGRIETYKGVELAIRACIAEHKQLLIAGVGQDLEKMKKIVDDLHASELITFLGYVTEEEKIELFYRSKALIYPVKDEDFGIVPVEANSAGCPVIAFNNGGVTETISIGSSRTGVFFDEYTWQSLSAVLKDFDKFQINKDNCKNQASLFAREIFEYKLKNLVKDVLSN